MNYATGIGLRALATFSLALAMMSPVFAAPNAQGMAVQFDFVARMNGNENAPQSVHYSAAIVLYGGNKFAWGSNLEELKQDVQNNTTLAGRKVFSDGTVGTLVVEGGKLHMKAVKKPISLDVTISSDGHQRCALSRFILRVDNARELGPGVFQLQNGNTVSAQVENASCQVLSLQQ